MKYGLRTCRLSKLTCELLLVAVFLFVEGHVFSADASVLALTPRFLASTPLITTADNVIAGTTTEVKVSSILPFLSDPTAEPFDAVIEINGSIFTNFTIEASGDSWIILINVPGGVQGGKIVVKIIPKDKAVTPPNAATMAIN